MVHLRVFLAAMAPFGPLIEIKTRAIDARIVFIARCRDWTVLAEPQKGLRSRPSSQAINGSLPLSLSKHRPSGSGLRRRRGAGRRGHLQVGHLPCVPAGALGQSRYRQGSGRSGRVADFIVMPFRGLRQLADAPRETRPRQRRSGLSFWRGANSGLFLQILPIGLS